MKTQLSMEYHWKVISLAHYIHLRSQYLEDFGYMLAPRERRQRNQTLGFRSLIQVVLGRSYLLTFLKKVYHPQICLQEVLIAWGSSIALFVFDHFYNYFHEFFHTCLSAYLMRIYFLFFHFLSTHLHLFHLKIVIVLISNQFGWTMYL